ncbi:MAG: hypothetical protein Q9182_004389 [Xanthomendoza sp. 2 TL-2023]
MVSLRSSGRKQQTRLSFNPLPTSSPAAADLPKQIQSRAAAVRYDHVGSPTKKRRLRSSSRQTELDFKSGLPAPELPTPEPSSQVEGGQLDGTFLKPSITLLVNGGNTEDPIIQASSPTSSSEDDEPITPRKNERRHRGFDGTPQHRKLRSPIVLINPDGDHEIETVSRGRARLYRFSKGDPTQEHLNHPNSKPAASISSDDDSEPVPLNSSNRGGRTSKVSPGIPQRSKRNLPTPRSGLRFLQGGSTGSAPINHSQKDTAVTPTRSSKRANPSKHQPAQPTKQLGDSSSHSRGHVYSSSDDSDDSLMDELRTSMKKSEENPPEAVDSGEDSSIDAVKGRRRKKSPLASSSSDVEESDPVGGKQRYKSTLQNDGKRQGLTRPKRPATGKSARKKQLELLRKRRAGEEVRPSSDDDSLEIGEPDTDPSTNVDGHDDLDEYDEEFLDDEDAADSTLGQPPDITSIPLEFTRHAHKKPAAHFKEVVEWLVHNKFNPAFPRNDPVYVRAILKLDDEAQGYASKFISTAWKSEFSRALKRFPEYTRVDMGTIWDRKCEACGRSGHPAKHQLIFGGKPYNHSSLEDVSSDDDDDDAEADGDPQTKITKAFFLGRTCNANAETAHGLYHWRHALNHHVLAHLRREGHLAPAKIVERENWSTKRKEKFANEIVDRMELSGEMRNLYQFHKDILEVAREGKNGGKYFKK